MLATSKCPKGGVDNLQVWREEEDGWQSKALMPGDARTVPGACHVKNFLVVAGGGDLSNTSLNEVHVCDLLTWKWLQWPNMPDPVNGPRLLCHDGLVLLCGGRERQRTLLRRNYRTIYQIDPDDLREWCPHPASPLPTYSPGLLSAEGALLCVGGCDEHVMSVSSDVFYFRDEGQGMDSRWQKLPSLAKACMKPVVLHMPGKGLICYGGQIVGNHPHNVAQCLPLF